MGHHNTPAQAGLAWIEHAQFGAQIVIGGVEALGEDIHQPIR